LPRRIKIEVFTAKLVYFLLQIAKVAVHLSRQLVQDIQINTKAPFFHVRQNTCQGHFYLINEWSDIS